MGKPSWPFSYIFGILKQKYAFNIWSLDIYDVLPLESFSHNFVYYYSYRERHTFIIPFYGLT